MSKKIGHNINATRLLLQKDIAINATVYMASHIQLRLVTFLKFMLFIVWC